MSPQRQLSTAPHLTEEGVATLKNTLLLIHRCMISHSYTDQLIANCIDPLCLWQLMELVAQQDYSMRTYINQFLRIGIKVEEGGTHGKAPITVEG